MNPWSLQNNNYANSPLCLYSTQFCFILLCNGISSRHGIPLGLSFLLPFQKRTIRSVLVNSLSLVLKFNKIHEFYSVTSLRRHFNKQFMLFFAICSPTSYSSVTPTPSDDMNQLSLRLLCFPVGIRNCCSSAVCRGVARLSGAREQNILILMAPPELQNNLNLTKTLTSKTGRHSSTHRKP